MEQLYNYIIESLPDTEGYGNAGKVYDSNGVSNHSVFKQSIREEKQGDVGIFIINTSENTKMSGHACWVSEVQVVVNTINGDIAGADQYLNSLYENIGKNPKNDYIWIKSRRLINRAPVGKNQAGIHWLVLNLYLKYLVNQEVD